MDCERVRSQLSDYIDGELSAEAAAGVAGHIETCPGCAEVHADMSSLIALMRDADTIEEPAEFVASVRSRLSPRPAPERSPGARPWARLRAALALPSVRIPAAAAALAAVLLMVLYLPANRETGSLVPADIDIDQNLVQEKPAPSGTGVDTEGDFAREAEGLAVTEELKRVKKGNETEAPAASAEKAADEFFDAAASKQEPAAPARPVEESQQVPPASAPAQVAPKKDTPVSSPVAVPRDQEKESPVAESAPGRQERARGAPVTVDDVSEELTVTEPGKGITRLSTLSSSDAPAPEPAFGGSLEITQAQDSLVAAAVDSAGGRLLIVGGEEKARSGATIVTIPAERYGAFLSRLDEIGVSRAKLPDRVPGGIQAVTVKIVVTSPRQPSNIFYSQRMPRRGKNDANAS